MKIKKTKLIIYLALLLTIVLIFALFSQKKEKNYDNTIKLSEVTRSVFYAPQYVALKLGFFKENGLEVKLSSAEGSDKAMTALLAHQADVALLGTSSVISVKSQGKENCPLLFSQLTKKDGSFLVGRSENFSWKDLKGKQVIAGRRGGVPEMVFEHILRKLNLFGEVTLLTNIKFDLMGIAFSRGVGDYVCLFEPTASILKEEKSLYILKSLGKECENISYTGYCATPEYIKSNPEKIKAFTQAIRKAENWVHTHSAKEISEAIAPYFIDCSPDILEKCIENYLECDVWCNEPSFKENEFNLLENIMTDAGELENKVEFGEIIENKFALNSKD